MIRAGNHSFRGWLNSRIILFGAIVLFLIGAPLYMFLNEELTHGIIQAGDRFEVDLKALGNFPFDAARGTIEGIPPQYRALDGKRVVLTGQLTSPDEAGSRITHFVLVYNRQIYCFNGPPMVQECVFGRVPSGGKLETPGSAYAVVTGILHVKLKRDAGVVSEVYSLDVESIKPLG